MSFPFKKRFFAENTKRKGATSFAYQHLGFSLSRDS